MGRTYRMFAVLSEGENNLLRLHAFGGVSKVLRLTGVEIILQLHNMWEILWLWNVFRLGDNWGKVRLPTQSVLREGASEESVCLSLIFDLCMSIS